ncbi:hypothetical protein ACFVKB_27150 [Rhodococcus sp. NPDC127530]|uniref:hypothetical protein n=1 Tax=unclassified Rhodococcus (in: high G+C Gram-positive bacteria) TaxID=192944 RepID=UPI00363E07E9
MMDNFLPPKSYVSPLSTGTIVTAMALESRLDLIAAGDIGRMAAAAFADWVMAYKSDFDLANAGNARPNAAGS